MRTAGVYTAAVLCHAFVIVFSNFCQLSFYYRSTPSHLKSLPAELLGVIDAIVGANTIVERKYALPDGTVTSYLPLCD